MEYCLLQDIFPDWQKSPDGPTEISVGCNDLKAMERSRKEQKKKAKRCKNPALRYLEPDYPMPLDTDPDRPSLVPPSDIPAMTVGKMEGFQIPKVPGTGEQYKVKRPTYFGASEDDIEGFTAPFVNTIGEDTSYKVIPSKTEKEVAAFSNRGASETLLTPSLEDAWKPLTPAGSPTSFFQYLLPPGGQELPGVQERSFEESKPSDLSKKIDQIFERLDKLEKERKASTQTEILMFVGSGLGLLLALDLLTRKV